MGQVVRGGEQFETAIQADHRGQLLKQGADSGAVDAFVGSASVSPLLCSIVCCVTARMQNYGTKPLVVAHLSIYRMKAPC